MNTEAADLILRSDAIFTAVSDQVFSGYVVIKNGEIAAMLADGDDISPWRGEYTRVLELGDRLICPGFCDNHTFFTGYMSMRRGVDLRAAGDSHEALELLKTAEQALSAGQSLYGWGWSTSRWGALPDAGLLDETFPQRPVVAINDDKSYCWMNRAAEERYAFTAAECSAEARISLLNEMLADSGQLKDDMRAFMVRLAAQGITAIKDVCFNDSPSLMDAWSELEKEKALSLRVSIVSQAVSAPINLSFGEHARGRFQSPWLRFHGFKFMVDGVIADHTGDMLYPYADRPTTHNERPVNYDTLRQQVLAADAQGFNCCMNAEGDAAIRHCINIFAECRERDPNRMTWHSLSDLECPHPDDIPRMAALGLFAEVYAQILLLNGSETDAYMRERYGEAREVQFYDYAALFDADVAVTIGTDLPLFIPSIPDAMYAACCRQFPDGSPENGWHRDRGMTRQQLLTAWTLNSARHHGMEEVTGSLEPGKRADIAVFDSNLLTCPNDELRASRVVLTLADGRITHDLL
ncbi:amidohydrolase family protein [Klebsiella sp. RHBSTW-00484]|uniref:amidohydrolase n=1 Tax=unclassified Klebsiella TaxID=2608929 RepID=UPI0015E56464|nr:MULTISPECIES: amidohydrolase family protein [unclassified Klebsiella]MBA7843641.1 amidohydrolase family protein [Klebsiella sp. RHBSTW-00465]QLO39000.1 amidohydrolase family protein [Klebsiella sp. RHBSTW-00484]QLT78520.1 amidohydrolase family protein [Klebsiella sp. RHBSTW-00464]